MPLSENCFKLTPAREGLLSNIRRFWLERLWRDPQHAQLLEAILHDFGRREGHLSFHRSCGGNAFLGRRV